MMRQIDGHYEVLQELGSGMSGEVFLVRDPQGNKLTLKLLKDWQPGLDRETALQNFKQEFTVLKKLHHPAIAPILDFQCEVKTGRYYFTYEFIEGQNFLAATEAKSVDGLEALFVQALRALEYLHAQGLVHLDVKSTNLLVSPQGEVKLIDFGLATENLRREMVGTPSYMAPELIYNEIPDRRADLYSLGVLFYYCLARHNPFRAGTVKETLERQKKLVVEPVSKQRDGIPDYWDRILERLLTKNRSERYASASHVIRDINLLGGKSYPIETSDTLLSYLPDEGPLVGRKQESALAHELCLRLRNPPESEARWTLWVRGAKGSGKSRFLKELKYFCQLSELPVMIFRPNQVLAPPAGGSVILLEDVDAWDKVAGEHWLDFLQASPGVPLVMVVSSQTDYADPLPLAKALMSRSGSETITLGPLSKTELTHYIATLTGLAEPPAQLIDALYVRTDGNPLFVREILKALIAHGRLFDEQGRPRRETLEDIGVDFARLSLPETVRELVQKNYQELPHDLQNFLVPLTLLENPPAPDVLRRLFADADFEALQILALSRGLIEKNPLTGKVHFKNPLWAELIRDTIAPAERTQWHDRIATALLVTGAPSEEIDFHRGHGSDPQAAAQALFKLAQACVARGDGARASYLFEQLRPLDHYLAPETQLTWRQGLGQAYLQVGQYQASYQCFQELRPLLEKLGTRTDNISYQVDIHEKLAGIALKLCQIETAKADIQAGLTLLDHSPADPIRRMILENALAQAWCQEGKLERAAEQFEKTYQLWQSWPREEQDRVTNNERGFVYLLKGEVDKAITLLEEQLEFAKRLPKRYPEARCYYNLAEAYFAKKDIEKTIYHYEHCVMLARQFKSYDLLLRAYNGLGNIYSEQHATKKGIDYYLRALAIGERLHDRSSAAAIHCNLGILYQEQKEGQEAENHLLGAVRILKALPERSAYDLNYLARAYLELGALLRSGKSFESARDYLRDAEQLIHEHANLQGLNFWILHEFAQLYREQGRRDAYEQILKRLRVAASSPAEMRELEKLTRQATPVAQSSIPRQGTQPEPTMTVAGTKAAATASLATAHWKGLVRIVRYLNSERDLPFLLKAILRYALDLSGAETGLILLKNEQGGLGIEASLSTVVDQELTRFSTEIAGRVLTENTYVLTSNAQSDVRFGQSQSVHLLKIRAILALPITTPDAVIGVLYLDSRIQTDFLTSPDILELLQAFADQAGIAIETTRLFVKSQSRAERLSEQLKTLQEDLSLSRALLQEESLVAKTRYAYHNIIARSEPMRKLFKTLDKITDTPLTVLICGETGTGKELIAKALHYNSLRRDHEFVAVNCGAIPKELMESELFGHKAGAFSGATHDKIGLCELADGGTLLLDEIGELPPDLQVKILRFLQEKELRRIGETQTRKVDVRVLAATHQNLEERIRTGTFREDLYFRLSEITLQVPPLRERQGDIPSLVHHFMKKYQKESGETKKYRIEKSLLQKIISYDWPGNIRDLENFIRVACALAENNLLSRFSLPQHHPLARSLPETETTPQDLTILIDGKNVYHPQWGWNDYEKLFLAHAFKHHQFRAPTTAKSVGLSPPTVYRKVKEWGLETVDNAVYERSFTYREGMKLKEFRDQLFQAALTYHQAPYQALRSLGVSQGFFYKVMRASKESTGQA